MPVAGRRALLTTAALLLAAALGFLLGRSDAPEPRSGSGRTAAPAPPPAAGPAIRPPQLAVGLDTGDPGVLTPPAAGPIAGFDAARAVVDGIAPRLLRVEVRWDLVQPDAATPLDPRRPTTDGCARRGRPPCHGPVTLEGTLAAVAAAQRAHPGRFELLVTFWGMPAWAGEAGHGCRADAARAGARPLAPRAEGAYRAAIRAVAEAARAAGARIAAWTPWNEPNAPYFLDPQRASCAAGAAVVSTDAYGRMVRAMDAELRSGGPARGRLVLGELAAWAAPSERAVPAEEFLAALPDDVLCRADVVSLHGYLEARPRSGRGEPIAAGLRALDRRRCLDDAPAWITETGVGAPRSGGRRDASPAVLAAECRLMHQQLVRWYQDPRVTAAFQYSLREDRFFPVGLLDERLRRTYPVAAVWRAWAGTRAPGDPPPALPAACDAGADPRESRAPG